MLDNVHDYIKHCDEYWGVNDVLHLAINTPLSASNDNDLLDDDLSGDDQLYSAIRNAFVYLPFYDEPFTSKPVLELQRFIYSVDQFDAPHVSDNLVHRVVDWASFIDGELEHLFHDQTSEDEITEALQELHNHHNDRDAAD